ncbi:hypothetical protein ABFA07_010001 [Porites harrisoni]
MINFLVFWSIAATIFAAEENFRSSYLITRENKRLEGHAVKKVDSTSFMLCSQSCLRHSWCTSTNFIESFGKSGTEGNCELQTHDFFSINDDTKLIDQPGATFSMFLKGCLLTGCLNGGSCVFNEEKETFACACKVPWSGEKCELDNWKKINIVPVCFGARNDSYGTFHITESGLINTFKLVHINGSVLCSEDVLPSYWGCNHTNYGNTTLLTVITFQNRTALWLADYKMGEPRKCKYSYGIKGTGVNATELVFNELPSPISAFVGQEFQIWFGQDLANCTEYNNSGQTCVDVYALYASTR